MKTFYFSKPLCILQLYELQTFAHSTKTNRQTNKLDMSWIDFCESICRVSQLEVHASPVDVVLQAAKTLTEASRGEGTIMVLPYVTLGQTTGLLLASTSRRSFTIPISPETPPKCLQPLSETGILGRTHPLHTQTSETRSAPKEHSSCHATIKIKI